MRYVTEDINKKPIIHKHKAKPEPVQEPKPSKYKFIRDNLSVSDIPGATVKQHRPV